MAASSDVKVKKELGEDLKEVSHEHRFYIQFQSIVNIKNEIYCTAPQTVLEAINSLKDCPEWAKLGENVVIQRTDDDPVSTVSTHFPCCLIRDKEKLMISKRPYEVEEAREKRQVLTEECYSVFYINNEVEKYTAMKDVFISEGTKLPGPLCVYGKKDINAAQALKQDGRFKTLSSFKLKDWDNGAELESSVVISALSGRKFQIKVLKTKQTNVPKQSKPLPKSATKPKSADTVAESDMRTDCTAAASNMAVVSALSHQSGVSVMKAAEESGASLDEIYEILRNQFSELKKLMESRFPADSFQNEVSLREENFGKLRQSFREVHRLKKLISLGELVCKVVVKDICTGTGFVLIDNYIMTNAHLFKTCTEGDRLKEGTEVYVQFNYEELLPNGHGWFKVENSLVYFMEDELDYAVLQVSPQALTQPGVVQFPSGLLERVGEMPENGEVCIIGHPGGEVKQMDPTFIIEMEKREQAAEQNLPQFGGRPFVLFVDQVKSQGIDRIMRGGDRAEKGLTYNTFMYHGASGSPVFDAQGFLCGLHTSGFSYDFPKPTGHVIEFAYSMKDIITHLVKTLREKNLTELLERMKEVAGGNAVLKEIFGPVEEPV